MAILCTKLVTFTHMHALKMLLLKYQICCDLSDQCYTSRSSCYGFIIQEVSKVCYFVPQPKNICRKEATSSETRSTYAKQVGPLEAS